MESKRLIPVLLYKNKGLYKGIKFKNHKYVGDPHNSIRVFNDKEVDELFLLDIEATILEKCPNINFIMRVAEECYMPFGIGGGIHTLDDIRKILHAGAEKVSINSKAILDPDFISKASKEFGSSTIAVAIDYRKNLFGENIVYIKSGTIKTGIKLFKHAKAMENAGAGELLITSINREGSEAGLDLHLFQKITNNISIPIIASGGIGSEQNIVDASQIDGLSAIAAGSFFTFRGPNRSVLISYRNPLSN